MTNLGNAWHLPTHPEPGGLTGMRDPVFPTVPVDTVTIVTGNQFQDGGNPGNQLQDGSSLLYRQHGHPTWTPSPLVFATTIGNNKYYTAPIPMAGFPAGTLLEYYLRIAYDDHDTTYLMANDALSTTTADEKAAQATPFSFTVDTPHPPSFFGNLKSVILRILHPRAR
jgi:galactose oxidase